MSSSLLSSEKMINHIGNGGTRLIIWETLNLLFGKCLNLVSQLKKRGTKLGKNTVREVALKRSLMTHYDAVWILFFKDCIIIRRMPL